MVCFLLLLACQEARLPVPDATAQKEAERVVRDVFKEDYARPGLAERRALARKLLAEAQSKENDAATRYVLLRDAGAFGDVETGLKAVDATIRLFVVDAVALRLAVLSAALAPTPEEAKVLAEACLGLVDEALAAGQVDAADKAAQHAVAHSRRAKDIPLVSSAQAKVRQVADQRARLEVVRKAERLLAEKPDDPGANATLGRYACLVRGDWTAGLPMLAKGDVPALRDLAVRELLATTETSAQVAAGDGWWEVGAAESGPERANARGRALLWYGRAYHRTTGLTRLKLDARYKEMGRAPEPEPGVLGPFETDERGFVRNWLVLGPFPNPGNRGRQVDYLGGEAKHLPRSEGEVEAPEGKRLKWGAHASGLHLLDFGKVEHLGMRPGTPQVIAYAACWLSVEADQDVQIRIGSDDGCRLWMDHQDLGGRPAVGGAKIDQVTLPVKLTKGKHLILVKGDQVAGPFQFMLRCVTPDGQRAAGVKVWN